MTQPVRTAPTLAEFAAAAGVSRSTASRALNDSPRISEETKKRVRAAAKEVNFVPNARGRALAVGRTEIIAVLVTEPLSELFSDPATLGRCTRAYALPSSRAITRATPSGCTTAWLTFALRRVGLPQGSRSAWSITTNWWRCYRLRTR